MAILPASLDYTNRDFDAIVLRIDALLETAFPGRDKDRVEFGNILKELFAHVGDQLGYYLDNRTNEAFLPLARLRSSVLALVKLIGYSPRGAVASRVDMQFDLPAPAVGDVTLPAETLVRTRSILDPVTFRTLGVLVIPAGETQGTITAENSELRQDVFQGDGTADQELTLSSTPYLDDSAVVVATDGSYSQVENLLSSTATDRHYTVTVDESDRATLRFGDGTNGTAPSGTITVFYRVGGGAAGTVDAGSVSVLEGTFADEFGNPVAPTVTNPAASTPGVDRESVAEIRVEAPETVRTNERSVTIEDFEINARRVAGVGRALMLTKEQLDGIDENSGDLYVLPKGGGVATQALLDAVEYEVTVTRPKLLGFNLRVLPAPLLDVDVRAVVHFGSGADREETKGAVVANLEAYFAPDPDPTRTSAGLPQVDFGAKLAESIGDSEGKLPWSDIFDVVVDTTGVRKIDDANDGLLLNGVRQDVAVALQQFPVLGTVTVIDALTGAEV